MAAMDEYDDNPSPHIQQTPPGSGAGLISKEPLNFRNTQTDLKRLILWTSFHLFALLMSYTGVEFFNGFRQYKTNEFWPFVSYKQVIWQSSMSPMGMVSKATNVFSGIFSNYDWTEFAFYVGIAIVIYILKKINA